MVAVKPPRLPGLPTASPLLPRFLLLRPPRLLCLYLPLPEDFMKSSQGENNRDRKRDRNPPRPEVKSPGNSTRAAQTSFPAALDTWTWKSETEREQAGVQESPLVYRSCRAANTGKKGETPPMGWTLRRGKKKKKWSSADVSPPPHVTSF